jgi:hypothetical protein
MHLIATSLLRKSIVCALAACLCQCAAIRTAPDFARIAVGMNKEEVVKALGRPTHVSANGNQELFTYEWENFWDGAIGGKWSSVSFHGGKVTGYYTDPRPSTNPSMAEGIVRMNSAPRTTLNIQQNAIRQTAIQQNQVNVFR